MVTAREQAEKDELIGGALTDPRNRFIMASQPTRSSGFFRDSHHSKSKRQGAYGIGETRARNDIAFFFQFLGGAVICGQEHFKHLR